MKKVIIQDKIKCRLLIITIWLGIISLALFTILTNIIRARIINVDNVVRQLEAQREAQPYNPDFIPKVVVQRGLNYDKGLDFKCISWSTKQVSSGWSKDIEDSDFFVDYYVPPDKKAIICITPVLAVAITAEGNKPFLYEVYPTDYGLHIRMIVGVSKVRKVCKSLTSNVNCANSILSRQAIVRYEP